jgi:hypothetical protein
VDSASVSFRLPDDGPSGVFASGLTSEVSISDPEGRAAVYGMRWNRLAGAFQIRITAAKSTVRAGTVISQYLAAGGSSQPSSGYRPRGRGKWLAIGLGIAGAAVGLAVGVAASGGQPAPTAAPAPPPVQVGVPTIAVGGP